MSIEQNKSLVRRWTGACITMDIDSLIKVIDDFYTSDYTLHHPGSPDLVGIEGIEKYIREFSKDMSNFHWTIEDIFGEEDKLVARYATRYTQVSTAKQISFSSVSIFHFANGKIAEEWEFFLPEKGQE
jgi:predicted ester cyclase